MANTIQQLKMCQAFSAAGESVCYVSPAHPSGDPSWADISEYYGLSSRFQLKSIPSPDRNYNFPNLPVSDTNDQILTAWLLYMYFSGGFSDGDILFTRTLAPVRYFLQVRDWLDFGADISVWFEQHQVDRGIDDKLFGDQFYSQLDGLVCISERQKELIVETHSALDPEKILVAHDGVDTQAYDGVSTTRARERLDIDTEQFVVIYTGHLYPSKGVETLVEAAATFDAHCRIVGGTERDISRIKSEYTVPDNVTFTGFVAPSQVPLYQLSADVLVATVAKQSETDYFSPLKLFEYLAAGKPIVMSQKPEFEEVLTDGENALFVEPGSSTALAESVRTLHSDPELRTELGRQARTDAKQYDWQTRAEIILNTIHERTDHSVAPTYT